jgi:hypothetical protein
MIAFYRDRVQGDRTGGDRVSRLALARLWCRLLPDLVSTALAERVAAIADRRRATPTAVPFHYRRREESMSILHQDLRYAIRNMLQRPGFTAVVLATLALGIGANAAIFSVVNAVLLRPLPFAHVERIVDFAHQEPYSTVSEAEFVDYQRDMRRCQSRRTSRRSRPLPWGTIQRARPPRLARLLRIMGVRPASGSVRADEYYSSDEDADRDGQPWSVASRFAGDPCGGQDAPINGTKATIIGVMPAGFSFPEVEVAFWAPWRLNVDSLDTRNNHYLNMVGEIAPAATIEKARAQVRTLNQRWMTDFPETYAPSSPIIGQLTPIRDFLLGSTRPYLVSLLGAVAFILLIACVNVANLLLVRGDARRKEFAIRTALGASASRMVRQMLTESMLFAVFGAALGIGLAWLGVRAITAFAPGDLPRLDEVGVDSASRTSPPPSRY